MSRKITIKSTARPVGKRTVRVTTSISTGNKTVTKSTYYHK